MPPPSADRNPHFSLIVSGFPGSRSATPAHADEFHQVILKSGALGQIRFCGGTQPRVLFDVKDAAAYSANEVIVRNGGRLDPAVTIVWADIAQHSVIHESVDVLINRSQ